MVHWVYLLLTVIGAPVGMVAWRYAPRAFLMLVGGLTKDPERSRQCAEMVRLSRKDAKELPSYLSRSPDGVRSISGKSLARPRSGQGKSRPQRRNLNGIAN